jgi:hypothetical protein
MLEPGRKLRHIVNLASVPYAVGLNEGCLTLAFGNIKYILEGNTLKPFEEDVILPRTKGTVVIDGNILTYEGGRLALDGSAIGLPKAPMLGCFSAVGRLWLVDEETIHWIRLENRWLGRLQQAGIHN